MSSSRSERSHRAYEAARLRAIKAAAALFSGDADLAAKYARDSRQFKLGAEALWLLDRRRRP